MTFEEKMNDSKTYAEWGHSKWPHNVLPHDNEMNVFCAEAIAGYADYEEREIVQSYSWLLRPVVRWLRRATRQ